VVGQCVLIPRIDVGNTYKKNKYIRVIHLSDNMWAIDREKCLKCGACVAVCPVLALELGDSGIKNDKEKCTLCGVCTKICPVGAIEV